MFSEKAKTAQLKASRTEAPQPDRVERTAELPGAVIDEEELREQRRAAEEIDIAEGEAAHEAVARQARRGERNGEQRAETMEMDDELERDDEALQELQAVACEEIGDHVAMRLAGRGAADARPALLAPLRPALDRVDADRGDDRHHQIDQAGDEIEEERLLRRPDGDRGHAHEIVQRDHRDERGVLQQHEPKVGEAGKREAEKLRQR